MSLEALPAARVLVIWCPQCRTRCAVERQPQDPETASLLRLHCQDCEADAGSLPPAYFDRQDQLISYM